jgi:type II secretory pathway pseudopilin PulG
MKKYGQIWVETVIYTLIGLALIGIVLAIATPKINQARDKIVVEQTIDALNKFDEKMIEVLDRGLGNSRNIDTFTMKRGELRFDAPNDIIEFSLDDLKEPYSQPGEIIEFGRVKILSERLGKDNKVTLYLEYGGIANLQFAGNDVDVRKFDSAAIPYKFSMRNEGIPRDIEGRPIQGENIVINIEETSRR